MSSLFYNIESDEKLTPVKIKLKNKKTKNPYARHCQKMPQMFSFNPHTNTEN